MSNGDNGCDICGDGPQERSFGGGAVCEACYDMVSGGSNGGSEPQDTDRPAPPEAVDFSDTAAASFPETMLGARLWISWKIEQDRKIPRAPWAYPDHTDRYVSAKDPDVWADHETARKWTAKLPAYRLAYYLPSPSGEEVTEEFDVAASELPETPRVGLIDFDDVYDPETETVHPDVEEMLRELNTYADFSPSRTGFHALGAFTLPENVRALELDISTEEFPDAHIEVYDGKRYTTMSGVRLRDLPDDVYSVQRVIDRWVKEFDVTRDGADAEEARDPDLTKAEVSDIDSTADINDIFDALSHVSRRDIRLKSTQTEDGERRKSWDPSWEHSESGTRLGWAEDAGFIYRKGDIGLSPLQVVALEERIISRAGDYPTGDDFFDALDALRKRGASIPEYDPDTDPEYVRVTHSVTLPDTGTASERVGWWASDRTGTEAGEDSHIRQRDVYERTEAKIASIMDQGESAVLDGIMGSGKTYSTFSVASDRDEPMAYFGPRGELYEQAAEYAGENGYTYVPYEQRDYPEEGDVHIMPSVFRDCPTACGDHGQGWADRVAKLHSLGASPKVIHAMLDMPCESDNTDCPYHQKCAVETDEFEVIVGHYKHGHLPYIVSGRHAVFDENPSDAFSQDLKGGTLVTAVNTFLGFHDSPPFEDFNDLIANRDDTDRVLAAEAWFEQYDWEPDERNVINHEDKGYHALAPHAVYTILMGESVGDDSTMYRASLDNPREYAVYHEGDEVEGHMVRINTPPNKSLRYARSVIALDGTPLTLEDDDDLRRPLGAAPEWEAALGRSLSLRRVLDDDERRRFLQETQGLRMIQTTDAVKPYSSGRYTNWSRDAALLEAARDTYSHGKPTVFTTLAAREEYESKPEAGELAGGWDHYGNLRGTDEYADHRLGVLLGSPHHGDFALRIRAAMLGVDVSPAGKGVDREYGNAIGNGLLAEMRESTVAQAALRFGRDGDGAIILLHTAAFPEWLPLAGEGSVVTTWTDAQRAVMALLRGGDPATAQEIADHDDVDVSARQVLNILRGFADAGVVERQQRPEDKRQIEWADVDLDSAPVYGETSLPFNSRIADVGAAVDEELRTGVYTGSFVNHPADGRHTTSHIDADREGAGSEPPDEETDGG